MWQCGGHVVYSTGAAAWCRAAFFTGKHWTTFTRHHHQQQQQASPWPGLCSTLAHAGGGVVVGRTPPWLEMI